jgi:uncharacterized protein (TIGR02147 family)
VAKPENLKVENQLHYRKALLRELENRKKNNRSYSKRAFARDLGISPALLTQVLKERRGFSYKRAISVIPRLAFCKEEQELYLTQVKLELSRSPTVKRKLRKLLEKQILSRETIQLTVDRFDVISNWYNMAILQLLAVKGVSEFETDLIPQIKEAFALTETEINIALERLERLGLISRKSGKVQACHHQVISTDGIPSSAIREYHRQTLRKAERALENQDTKRRYSNSIVLPILHDHREAIQKDIFNFQSRMLGKYGRNPQKDGDEVYALSVQFFSFQEKSK